MEKSQLKFGVDGKFTILHIADMHLNPLRNSEEEINRKLDFIRTAVGNIKPDLVVLAGDNIFHVRRSRLLGFLNRRPIREAIHLYMSIFEELQAPVAMVFGNHDEECGMGRKAQMKVYQSYSCNLSYRDDPRVSEVSNYYLPIHSSDGGNVKYLLWMIDSGTYYERPGDHAWVKEDQVAWYVRKSEGLKAAYGPVDAMAFQHIIVPEIYDALLDVPPGTPGAVTKPDAVVQIGKYFALNPENTAPGSFMGEFPCAPSRNTGEFAAMRGQGNVRAIAVGHDHLNGFIVRHQGIDIINTPGCMPDVAGGGARVITLNESDTSQYESYIYTFEDYFGSE